MCLHQLFFLYTKPIDNTLTCLALALPCSFCWGVAVPSLLNRIGFAKLFLKLLYVSRMAGLQKSHMAKNSVD